MSRHETEEHLVGLHRDAVIEELLVRVLCVLAQHPQLMQPVCFLHQIIADFDPLLRHQRLHSALLAFGGFGALRDGVEVGGVVGSACYFIPHPNMLGQPFHLVVEILEGFLLLLKCQVAENFLLSMLEGFIWCSVIGIFNGEVAKRGEDWAVCRPV